MLSLNYKYLCIIACLIVAIATASNAADTTLFKADFEGGLKASGATPDEPKNLTGAGFENTVIDSAFPAQGSSCFRLKDYAVWHIGKSDIKGRLSLWFMPMSLPADGQEQEIIWGGDAAKPFGTLSVKVNHAGKVSFNYYSWQKNQTWLTGITTSSSIQARKWNHIMLTWGDSGQRIYLNGKLDAGNDEKYPMSWLFDIRFGGGACYLDDIQLSSSEEPIDVPTVSNAWRPTTTGFASDGIVFKADFEDGLKAYGATPPEPRDAVGGGYEVTAREDQKLKDVALDSAFPAQGKSCFRLGNYAVWHIGKLDIKGRLSLWFMPMSLPGADQEHEIIWGGDAAKPYQALSVKVNHAGKVFFNYYSWQKNQTWLTGIISNSSIQSRKWNHIMLTWGDSGQRIYINGKLDAENDEKYPMSWIADLKFGGTACYLDDIQLSTSEEPIDVKPVANYWRPTTKLQKELSDIEKGAAALIRNAPKGSDAYCRGLVIDYAAKSCWAGVLQSPVSALTSDNVSWMSQAIRSTSPFLRKGELPVPSFDASKKIVIKDGRVMQDGHPTFLLGMYNPNPIDNTVGFNLSNALMPGPGYTLITQKDIGDTGVSLASNIEKLQKKNKVTDILLSLNVPGWLYQTDPLVSEGGSGWFNYNNEAASVRKAFKDTADIVMPNVKNHVTNLMVNLGNEPANSGYSPTTTGPKWRAWLKAKHGSIENLNEAWGTNYASFDEVNGPSNIKAAYVDCADPGGLDVPTDPKVLGQWYDWCLFNQERYANFFADVRNNIAKYQPDTLFSIKWLSNYSGWWKSIGYALNPYDVTKVCDFAGCDAWTIYAGQDPKSYWGIWWDDFCRTYDLLKSIAPNKPIINSENHILRGNDPSAPPLKYG